MIGDALYTMLSTASTVTALVSTRIYPVQAPESASYPLIQVQQITGVREYDLSGPIGIAAPRFQIDSYAELPTGASGSSHVRQARLVARAVRRALNGFRGVVGDTEILNIKLETEQELTERDGQLARVSQDYITWCRED